MASGDKKDISKSKVEDFPLNTLYLNPTKYCNLCCRHCWIAPPVKDKLIGEDDEMSIDETIAIIAEAIKLGLTAVKLTGGEPLLREDLEKLLEYCYKKNIKVTIETNGTLVTKEMAGMLETFRVSHISVSLDSSQEEAHDRFRGKKGAFAKAIEGIKNLKSKGFSPQVIMTLYRENMAAFGEFLDLMKQLEIDNIKVNVISPIGKGSDLVESGLAPSVKEVLDFAGTIDRLRKDFKGKIHLDVPIAFKSIDEIKFKGHPACAIKSILGILSDGRVSICGVGYVDDSLIFGNLRKDPSALADIWRNTVILKEIREELSSRLEGVCGICVFKKRCLGSCRAAAYYNTGNLYEPCWFCQEAYDKGMFPTTRLIPESLRV